MQTKDKISKASWNHFAGAKDTTLKNITIAVQNGNLKVDADVLPQLLSLIGNSLDEGYHRGHRVFDREISSIVSQGDQKGSIVPAKKKLNGVIV